MKNYLITYRQTIRPAYKIVNHLDYYDIRNMDETVLVSDGNTYTMTIEAPNKEIAKGLFAVRIADSFGSVGFRREMTIDALRNIVSIERISID